MSTSTEKPPKIGTEITVRISLTFQEAPDIHTLLAMTPVRERGKLVRSALERYIAETAHPAGNVEEQINAISTWLRSRATIDGMPVRLDPPLSAYETAQDVAGPPVRVGVAAPLPPRTNQVVGEITEAPISLSINRWLEA
jgi:hypothetical protein